MKVKFKSEQAMREFASLMEANRHIAGFLGMEWWNAYEHGDTGFDAFKNGISILDDNGEEMTIFEWDVMIHGSELKYFDSME